MSQSIVLSSAKFVFIDLIGDILYFPLWWYTAGAKKAFLFFWQKLKDGERELGVWVWVTNLFRPMYNQTDWQSQIISFFMRLIQIIFRSVFLAVWTIFLFVCFLIWLLAPVFIVYQIKVNYFG